MTTRRQFLTSMLAATVGTALPLRGWSAASAPATRFLFVWNDGGWDPLCVFAPLFDSAQAQMQAQAQPMQFGDLRLVDHPSRPNVRAFFAQNHDQVAVINGLSVPSVSHDICSLLTLTGTSGGDQPDWATRLAHAARATHTLPSVVLSGPSFTANLGTVSSRVGANGQLQQLIDGGILEVGDDLPTIGYPDASRSRVDAWVAEAAVARSAERGGVSADLADSLRRALALQDEASSVDLGGFYNFRSGLRVAVDALGQGLARCVSVSSGGYSLSWDSHANNDSIQSPAFDRLFGRLQDLQGWLHSTPAPEGGMLGDSTVVVVLSEMGRTPRYNESAGRDHWPYTSALLFGGPLRGGQVISGYSDGLHGLGYDAAGGYAVEGGTPLTPAHLGATLLALADVDPGPLLLNTPPIASLLP